MTDEINYHNIKALIDRSPALFSDLKQQHLVSFLNWLPQNTHIVKAFGKYARQLQTKGNRKYYSAYCIRERIRWDSMTSEIGTEYKISNNVTPFLARLIMRMDHNLIGMFKTKDSTRPSFDLE